MHLISDIPPLPPPPEGWPVSEIRAAKSCAAEDLYDELTIHLCGVFSALLDRIATGKAHLELLKLNSTLES
ncbi:uncharacterized protein F4812DRAFT_177851 [Daldinia caldariorum]|uniref:uncharacterized protein n=1 Tax=Daldinia caldariorum TaxID=326644 RepID=UPI00200767B4|nr:uncharacterized protein F4812DRAFT_177851 [Daldinia caldariorum]KAI1471403.1 hypothetical protein F4812DRAFT_177851 [Daldinia caldariorum]